MDQAIEFALPDDEGRRRLVRLHARGLRVPDCVTEVVVRKTDRASAAFIKELMRRSARCNLEAGGDGTLAAALLTPVLA